MLHILKVSSKSWEGDPVSVLTICKSYMGSVMDYGSFLYVNASYNSLNKLNILQNTCLRLILNGMRPTPVAHDDERLKMRSQF